MLVFIPRKASLARHGSVTVRERQCFLGHGVIPLRHRQLSVRHVDPNADSGHKSVGRGHK